MRDEAMDNIELMNGNKRNNIVMAERNEGRERAVPTCGPSRRSESAPHTSLVWGFRG